MQWHDGVNPDVVLNLEGEERDEAEDLLIQSIKEGGMWPTKGLAVMKSKKAVPILKEQLKKAGYGSIRIRLAEALALIEEAPEYVDILIDELKNTPSEYARLEAARLLRKFPRADVVDALYGAIMDPSYLVRSHATESLLAIHGLTTSIPEYKEFVQFIYYSEDFAKRSGDHLNPKLRGKDPDKVRSELVNILKNLFKDKKTLKKG